MSNSSLAVNHGIGIEGRVRAIIAGVLCVDESVVVSGARFREDLGADSLDLCELIIAFSEVFTAEIQDDKVQQIQTVGEVVAYLEQNVGSRA
jgi:acyl carrier protein